MSDCLRVRVEHNSRQVAEDFDATSSDVFLKTGRRPFVPQDKLLGSSAAFRIIDLKTGGVKALSQVCLAAPQQRIPSSGGGVQLIGIAVGMLSGRLILRLLTYLFSATGLRPPAAAVTSCSSAQQRQQSAAVTAAARPLAATNMDTGINCQVFTCTLALRYLSSNRPLFCRVGDAGSIWQHRITHILPAEAQETDCAPFFWNKHEHTSATALCLSSDLTCCLPALP